MTVEAREIPNTNGQWEKKATDPAGIREIMGEHGPEIVKRGQDAFEESYKRDMKEGFERITDPEGNETFVRRDRVQTALNNGYGVAGTRGRIAMTVPELPWQRDRRLGERYEDYKRRVSGQED